MNQPRRPSIPRRLFDFLRLRLWYWLVPLLLILLLCWVLVLLAREAGDSRLYPLG